MQGGWWRLTGSVASDVAGAEDRRRHHARLVPQVLLAAHSLLGEPTVRHGFKPAGKGGGHRIPQLRGPPVQVVDGVQVHVFLVPRKHGAPGAKVQHCARDSPQRLARALAEHRVKLVQVPAAAVRVAHEAALHVCTIQGCFFICGHVAPECFLDLFKRCCFVCRWESQC